MTTAAPLARGILFRGPMVRAILAGRKGVTRRIMKPQPRVYDEAGDADPAWDWPSRDGKRNRAGCGSIRHMSRDLASLCPYGKAGGILFVKETWAPLSRYQGVDPGADALARGGFFAADQLGRPLQNDDGSNVKWTPAIHMPRAASRINLTLTRVRVERLQAITRLDAIAEGLHQASGPRGTEYGIEIESPGEKRRFIWDADPLVVFRKFWNTIHAQWKPIISEGSRVVGYECHPWAIEDAPPAPPRVARLPHAIIENPFLWVLDFERTRPTTDLQIGSTPIPRHEVLAHA